MVSNKKKLCFYSLLSSGHLNVCTSLAKVILDKYSDKVDIYFIVDKQWAEKLEKIDSRFKFKVYEYDDSENHLRMVKIVDSLESVVDLPCLEKMMKTWKMFTMEDPTLLEVDQKSEEQIRDLKPDFVLSDQVINLPSLSRIEIPYGFIVSANPLLMDFDGFPKVASGCSSDNVEEIKAFEKEISPFKDEFKKFLYDFHEKRNSKYTRENRIDQLVSDHLSIYCFPKEIDYFDDTLRQKYNLIQIDTPLNESRIPKPYKLPEEFRALPGEIIYLSLGSLFSNYTHRIQKIVDVLEKLPYKYIVSKGLYGDKLKLPSNKFIGENYIDQLAVLQVVDAMIAHGGNNSLGECFYFGVKCIIVPVLGDQISNAKRIEETGYGLSMNLSTFTEQELSDKLHQLLNDKELDSKWKEASERIRRESRIVKAADKIVDYLDKL